MPKCKYCNKEISKFDSDMCPYCGERFPIDENYKTMDITQNIKKSNPSYKLYKSKKKSIYLVLCLILGFLGFQHLYLGFKKKTLTNLILFVTSFVIFGFLLYYFNQSYKFTLLIDGILCLVIFNIFQALFFLLKDSPKDAKGEFLR